MPLPVFALLQTSDTAGQEAINQAIASAIANGSLFRRTFFGPYLVAIISVVTVFSAIGFIGWLLYRRGQTQLQARTEFHRQLLDKFTSGTEFAGFLNSSGGQRLLQDLAGHRVDAKERIIRGTRFGVVLTVLGLAALLLRHDLAVPGALVLALGIGLLLSAAISYRLSRHLGVLDARHNQHDALSQPS